MRNRSERYQISSSPLPSLYSENPFLPIDPALISAPPSFLPPGAKHSFFRPNGEYYKIESLKKDFIGARNFFSLVSLSCVCLGGPEEYHLLAFVVVFYDSFRLLLPPPTIPPHATILAPCLFSFRFLLIFPLRLSLFFVEWANKAEIGPKPPPLLLLAVGLTDPPRDRKKKNAAFEAKW